MPFNKALALPREPDQTWQGMGQYQILALKTPKRTSQQPDWRTPVVARINLISQSE